jgi:hypothetical protein
MRQEITVVGRPLGTVEWARLREEREYNTKQLEGYWLEDDNGKRFYLPDQIELRKFADLQQLWLEVAKESLYSILRHEGCADDRNVDHVTKENQIEDAIKYANLFIKKINEK